MSRSSIFSFDTLKGSVRPSLAVLAVMACYGLVRAFLFFRPDDVLYLMEEHTMMSQSAAEIRYREDGPKSPKVVVIGSSRLYPVPSDWWPEYFDLPTDEVASVMRPGNTFWNSAVFLRRNPEILENAEVVVIDIFPFQLFLGFVFTEKGELFLKRSTIPERILVGDPKQRAIALFDMVVPAWSDGRSAKVWRDAAVRQWGGRDRIVEDLLEEVETRQARNRQRGIDEGLSWMPQLLRSMYIPDPVVSQVQVHAIEELRDMMPPGCTLLLTWLPVYSGYDDFISGHPVKNESDRMFHEILNGFNEPPVSVIWYEDMAAAGFTGEDFTDGVHYSEDGMKKICALIAKDARPYITQE